MTWREEHCPPECPRGLLSTEQHVSRARAAGSPGPLNHTRNWSSRPAAQPTPGSPQASGPLKGGPAAQPGWRLTGTWRPRPAPGQTESPAPPSSTWTHDTVSLTHPHGLAHSHAHTGSHTRCSQAHTHVARAPRAPHSQLLQGEALDGFPGQRLQGVGGQVPAGAGQQTDPVSDPL